MCAVHLSAQPLRNVAPSDETAACHLLHIRKRKVVGLHQSLQLLETHLVDEGVQCRDGTAQIGDTPIKGLDLLLQLRNALAIGDHGSLLLTTILASANSRDFCTLSADTA